MSDSKSGLPDSGLGKSEGIVGLKGESSAPINSNEIWRSVHLFLDWLEKHTCESYDPYDIWGTWYGLRSRRLYYAHRAAGTPFVAPVLLLEKFFPGARRLLVFKKRYATADAQLVLAFLNLYRISPDRSYLGKAVKLGKDLEATRVPGYSGHCWGYPFDWQHSQGLWKRNTPFITATPYCFEAFLGLFDATKDPAYLELAASIARFVYKDLRDTPTSANGAAGSYSPVDNSQVINASAYRAMVLVEAACRFRNEEYMRTAQRNINFILETQQSDGAWLYSIDHGEQFIDHFHTCFVLKNLVKLNRRLASREVSAAIQKGFAYYTAALFGRDGLPKMYAIKPRTQIVRLEMYDFAESINLGTVARDLVPAAFARARELAAKVIGKYQLRDGHFVTRVYVGGVKHTFPFLRWPQAQMFHALTNLLLACHAAPSPDVQLPACCSDNLDNVPSPAR